MTDDGKTMRTRDVIARGCCHASNCGRESPSCAVCLQDADAIIAALASNGLIIVPAEPTEAMEIAGQIDPIPVSSGDIYRAMIAKANPPYSGDGPFDVGPRYSWPGETK